MRARAFPPVFAALALAASSALAEPTSPIERARAYAVEGQRALAEGRFREAAKLFEQADHVYPTPNYKYYVAQALAKLGELKAAASVYEAAARPLPEGAPEIWKTARAEAATELAAVRRRLGVLRVTVVGPAEGQTLVRVDGAPAAESTWARIEVDPGAHAITAEARGFGRAAREVSIAEGATARVELVLTPEPARGADADVGLEAATPGGERDLSHEGQWGLFARADLEVSRGGARAALGVSWGALGALDLHLAALLGGDKGLEPAVQINLLRGRVKPYVDLGAPVFFHEGAYPGVRAAGGVAWDIGPHVGLFLQMGGGYFPNVPPGYVSAVVLPAAGISGRL